MTMLLRSCAGALRATSAAPSVGAVRRAPRRCGLASAKRPSLLEKQKLFQGTLGWYSDSYKSYAYNWGTKRLWVKFEVRTGSDGRGSLAAVRDCKFNGKFDLLETRGLPHVGGEVPLVDQRFGGTGWDTSQIGTITGSLKQPTTDRIEVTFDPWPHPNFGSQSTFHKASATEREGERERREKIEREEEERERREKISNTSRWRV